MAKNGNPFLLNKTKNVFDIKTLIIEKIKTKINKATLILKLTPATKPIIKLLKLNVPDLISVSSNPIHFEKINADKIPITPNAPAVGEKNVAKKIKYANALLSEKNICE
jgi:hypothetical protein